MSTVIKPTVGRVVHYFLPSKAQLKCGPLAAIVTKVHDDAHVNLAVFYEDGSSGGQQNVYLRQADGAPLADGGYCEWPVIAVSASLPPIGSSDEPKGSTTGGSGQPSVAGAGPGGAN